jgi:hypothetical protein
MDPDADQDPVIFVSHLQDVNKKLFFFKVFLLITVLFEGPLHHFSNIKSHKEVTKQWESMFF